MKKGLLGLAALVGSFSLLSGVKAAPIDDAYNLLVKGGVFEVGAVAPTDVDDKNFYLDTAVNKYVGSVLEGKYGDYMTRFANLENCNESLSECDLRLSYYPGDGGSTPSEEKIERVKVVWKEADKSAKSVVDGLVEKIMNSTTDNGGFREKGYILNDLDLVSGLYHSKKNNLDAEIGIHYVKELRDIIGSSNITYELDCRLGDMAPFYTMAGGVLSLWYNGVIYSAMMNTTIGVANNYIIYVPEDTEATPDAYIAAAKKRIEAYLGRSDVQIVKAGNIDDIEDIESGYIEIDKTKTGEFYYKVTMNGKTYDFLIMKNKDVTIEVETPVVETKDIATEVSVKTTSPDVPMDTKVTVNEVKREAKEFVDFVEKVKKDVVKAFDISLYSKTVGNITKLEKGVFEVRLPLGVEYVGRKLSAYYLKDDGSLEEHPITLDASGNAVFETTHFSTYFIAEASNRVNEEVPKTFDKADVYIMLAISGAIGLVSSLIFFRTKSN